LETKNHFSGLRVYLDSEGLKRRAKASQGYNHGHYASRCKHGIRCVFGYNDVRNFN